MLDYVYSAIEYANKMINNDSIFWFCAIVGTAIFIIQLLLSFLGTNDADDIDVEDSGKFKWLSRQAMAGFLMMFGWTALTCLKEFHLNGFYGLAIAFASGLVTIFTIGSIFRFAKRLHSSGSIFKIDDAIGQEAMVYQRISAKGKGKVSVSINNLTHEIEATADKEIESFTKVYIIKKADNDTVVVVPVP